MIQIPYTGTLNILKPPYSFLFIQLSACLLVWMKHSTPIVPTRLVPQQIHLPSGNELLEGFRHMRSFWEQSAEGTPVLIRVDRTPETLILFYYYLLHMNMFTSGKQCGLVYKPFSSFRWSDRPRQSWRRSIMFGSTLILAPTLHFSKGCNLQGEFKSSGLASPGMATLILIWISPVPLTRPFCAISSGPTKKLRPFQFTLQIFNGFGTYNYIY